MTNPHDVTMQQIRTNRVRLNVAVAGEGPAVVLLHGFPHTWRLWSRILPSLAVSRRVIAPDLRGLGASERAADGYDLHTISDDIAGILDALNERTADVVAIDLGAPPAFMLAMRHPGRVRRLVLGESLLGQLPGAEKFLQAGPPWWFGFHSVPGFAESVLLGHEQEYIDWFLKNGTAYGKGLEPDIRKQFLDAYTGRDALRCAFAYYRAAPRNAQQVTEAVQTGRLTVPTMTIGAQPIGDSLYQQLKSIGENVQGRLIEHCGHIMPLDQPEQFLTIVESFLQRE